MSEKRPNSKIIQITSNEYDVIALCEDGSIWIKSINHGGGWCCLLGVKDE